MATTMSRITVSIPADIEQEIEKLKQEEFFDKPYSELYRQALKYGIKQFKAEQQKKDLNSK